MVNWLRFVARAEIEDAARPAKEAAATAEDFAALKPTDKDQRIRRGDVKAFAVHLGLRHFEIGAQSGSNGMPRLHHPDPFLLTRLAPFQVAGRAHQPLEDF